MLYKDVTPKGTMGLGKGTDQSPEGWVWYELSAIGNMDEQFQQVFDQTAFISAWKGLQMNHSSRMLRRLTFKQLCGKMLMGIFGYLDGKGQIHEVTEPYQSTQI